MREWLGPDKVVRSLEPKLAGRTNLGRGDAKILFELFLSRWHRGENIGEEKPYVSDGMNGLVEALLDTLYPKSELNNSGGILLPDRRDRTAKQANKPIVQDLGPVFLGLFEESDALITVSRTRTISDSPDQIRLFQCLIDDFRKIDDRKKRDRLLIWIVDLGRRHLDVDALQALKNIESLAFQFRALALVDYPKNIERWNWLRNRAIILFGGLRLAEIDSCYKIIGLPIDEIDLDIPWFNSGHLFLIDTPDRWTSGNEFRLLYGEQLEDLGERAFSIHLRIGGWEESIYSQEGEKAELRYFGLAPPDNNFEGGDGNRQRRLIELSPPSRRHNDAFWIAYSAASFRLGGQHLVGIGDAQGNALAHLRHHNFAVLKVSEFLDLSRILIQVASS